MNTPILACFCPIHLHDRRLREPYLAQLAEAGVRDIVLDNAVCIQFFVVAAFRKLKKAVHQLSVITITRPNKRIRRNHFPERKNTSAIILVANANPNAVILRLTLFQNTFTEL